MAKSIALIQTQTLTSTATSVTFSNIPQNYTDLKIVVSARNAYSGGGAANCYLTFNGNGANYSGKYMTGTGASATSAGNTGGTSVIYVGAIENNSWTASTFGNLEVYIPNYTSSNNKSISWDSVTENNATTAYAQLGTGLWSNSAAITSITFTPESATGDWVSGCTFTLYGIGGNRASGGTITYDGTYTYHTFTSTGTFLPLEKIKGAEVLCIAGGGGASLGGGGAGGLVYRPGQTLVAGNTYTAMVGAGGAGATSNGSPSPNASNGGDSVFASIVATGGGGGGGTNNNLKAGSGGSGGGAGAVNGTPGDGTSGQGNNGGTIGGFSGANYPGGGGGGAGAVGGNATSGTAAGVGGNGSLTYSSWGFATSTGQNVGGVYYYAGGGGGGVYNSSSSSAASGGYGGGGNGSAGSANALGTAGTANTGGGAGGGNAVGLPAGGSGLIIIRYPSN